MKISIILSTIALCAGLGYLRGTSSVRAQPRASAARESAVFLPRSHLGPSRHADHLACAGGPETPIAVELVPAGMRATSSGRVLDAELVVRNRLRNEAHLRFVVEWLNDRGLHLPPSTTSAVMSIQRDGSSGSIPISVPRDVPVGYYLLRVTVAAVDGNEDAVQSGELYFHLQDHTLTELSNENWQLMSGISEGSVR